MLSLTTFIRARVEWRIRTMAALPPSGEERVVPVGVRRRAIARPRTCAPDPACTRPGGQRVPPGMEDHANWRDLPEVGETAGRAARSGGADDGVCAPAARR
jgi:hypothetical protein